MTQRDTFEQTQADYKPIKDALLLTDTIRRTLDQTQNSLNNSVLDVELTDLSLQLATIHSPFDGVVVSVNIPAILWYSFVRIPLAPFNSPQRRISRYPSLS